MKTFFFGEHLCLCPWPRECLSSERLSLALDFFCVFGLEPCVLDSTSGNSDLVALNEFVKNVVVSSQINHC